MPKTSRFQRRLATGAFLAIAAPVALGSVAYACQSMATLQANPGSATAGSSLTLTGRNYSGATGSSPIDIHLDTRAGLIIASIPAASVLSGSAVIPADTALGVHTLIATQTKADGNPVSGTPGRASVSIIVAGKTSEGAAATPVAAAASDPVVATTTAATATPVTPVTPAVSAAAPVASVASAPSASPVVPGQASAVPAATTANVVPAAASAATTPSVATAEAAPAAAAPAAAAIDQSTPVAGPASVNVGLLAASSDSSSRLPGLTLAAGLAVVLLGLGAFVKSGRNMLGRGFGPLAG